MHYRIFDHPEQWQLEQRQLEKGAYRCPPGIKIEQRLQPQTEEAKKDAN